LSGDRLLESISRSAD